jgi:hypothetical protein
MTPLSIVAELVIPPAVLTHRFCTEAHTIATHFARADDVHKQVIGTANTRAVELYGWPAASGTGRSWNAGSRTPQSRSPCGMAAVPCAS